MQKILIIEDDTYINNLIFKALSKEKSELLEKIETITPTLFRAYKGVEKDMCANVDLYSGLVYRMLDIPVEMYTPLFAISRVSGWCAHRIEELETAKKIIRPGYKCIAKKQEYTPLLERD